MADLSVSHDEWRPSHNPYLIAITVTLATFMEVLDSSIANVALPHIAGSLGATYTEATWVLTSYLVSAAIVLPVSGWLSTVIGRKRFYMICVLLFTVCSFLCGIAQSLPMLIVARILQGAGGGGLQPSEQAILADSFPTEKRGMAFALYGMAVVVAPAIGPTLGGWITDNFNWHWIFFINIPIGALSLFFTSRMVEDPPWFKRERSAGIKIDYIGLALIVLGVSCLQVVLDKGQEDDWFASPMIRLMLGIGLPVLIAFFLWEWYHRDPIVDVRLLKNRNFGTAVFFSFILGMVLFGSTVLIPEFLQVSLGYTAERAGMALSPAGFVLMAMMPIDGRITASRADPREKNNQVSGLSNFARNLGGSIGTSLLSTFLARQNQIHQVAFAAHTSHGDPNFERWITGVKSVYLAQGFDAATATNKALASAYGMVQSQASTLSFENSFWVMSLVIACLVPLPMIMRRPKPGEKQPSLGH